MNDGSDDDALWEKSDPPPITFDSS